MAVVDAAAGDLEEHHELEVPHARFERAALALVLEPNEHPPALGQLVHAMKRARREFIDAAQDRLEARLIERYEQIAVPPPAPLRELIAGATHPMPE